MSTIVPKKLHSREVLLFCFHSKKSAAESHRMLCETYGEHAPSISTCEYWFRRFKSGDFDTDDKEREGRPRIFVDADLEAALDEDPCQTQDELATALGVCRTAISKRLKAIGMVQKFGNWVPHELKPRDVERRVTASEMLLQRYKAKSFLHRIVTGDEKWIRYDNPKRKLAYVKRGEQAPSTPKPNIHGSKVMLCVWWDQKGIVHHELLESGQTINGTLYRQQLMRLKKAIAEKRPEWATRHETLIFHHDNARPHVAQVVKTYLDGTGWEVLTHPPYSPDLAPSDYHLFRSMQNKLSGKRFTSVESIENWLDSFFDSKDEKFYWDGIHALPEKWAKVIASDGQYFE